MKASNWSRDELKAVSTFGYQMVAFRQLPESVTMLSGVVLIGSAFDSLYWLLLVAFIVSAAFYFHIRHAIFDAVDRDIAQMYLYPELLDKFLNTREIKSNPAYRSKPLGRLRKVAIVCSLIFLSVSLLLVTSLQLSIRA